MTKSRSLTGALLALATTLVMPAAALAATPAGQRPAGGAAIEEIIIATVGAMVVTTVLLVLGIGHRTGRIPLLGSVAGFAERVSGMPGWVSLPSAFAAGSLIVAVVGMYWDISLHIDEGRDVGPLANPAHYLILAGLFGIFAAGFIAMVLPTERTGPTAIHIAGDWYAPLGGVLICACGAFSLLGFPLDDVWHRLFGQDVTLWGPTHLMLIGGAAMTLVGIAVLHVEGTRANAAAGREGNEPRWVTKIRLVGLTGGFLIGLSTFQGEFDFGVPQFQLVLEPIMLMVAAGAALVAARLWLGRGAALGAALFFVVVRGGLALLVGPILGETTPHLPLFLAEAAIVELVALRVSTSRPLAFGATCGVFIGTFGLAAEWGWSHLAMPFAWPGSMLLEIALAGFVAAVAGALIGAWIGSRLGSDSIPRVAGLRRAAAAAAVLVALLVGVSLYTPADSGVTASVTLDDVGGGSARTVDATVRLGPSDAADDSAWLNATAWQGGGLVVNELERVSDGVYRTTEPIPVYGNWKSLIRLHDGNSLTAVPIFLPEDAAIPAAEVPAEASFTREFVSDNEILQRESRGAASWVTVVAYGAVFAVALLLLALLAWGLHHLGATGPGPTPSAGHDGAERRTPTPAGPLPAAG